MVQLAPYLRSGRGPLPSRVDRAVLERVRVTGPELGEPELVPLLADLAPGRIASESWSGMFELATADAGRARRGGGALAVV